MVRMQHREDMKVHDWRYTWAAKYNTTDTMLLVSGVLDEVDGMVAVFQVASSGDTGVFNVRKPAFERTWNFNENYKLTHFQGDISLYSMIAMVPNNPYDVMGSWCGNSAWLYGNLVPLADTFDIDAEIRSDWGTLLLHHS